MKKVVFEPETTINFKEVNNNSIVGIQWAYGIRSLVIKTEEGYIGISDDDISECWVKPSKMEYIEKAVSAGGTVFVFESRSEAFRWLGKVDSISDKKD